VLDTGLFSARGVDRFGWAHQTYAEFLAARYCTRRQMPIEQIRSLIFHPSDQGQRLIPQLYEVAAWMSVMNAEILKAVAASEAESLDRLNAKLHDELPAVRDLWNTSAGGLSPKDEQEVADYVVRHLRDDLRGRGIIVNREVQIRRGIGDRTGQRTDIYVGAVAPGQDDSNSDHICAIVEVKGNWNPDLSSAMETQLRDRYLKDNHCANGLYLVAWFSCAKWSENDSRKKRCSPLSLSEATDSVSRQAATLSSDNVQIRSYILDASLS
jgi:hypothetical protein